MIEVEAPDGTVVEFPEGTSPAVMKAAMAKRYGAPKPAPSLGQQAAAVIKDNAASVVENLFGLPDLAATALGRVAGMGARALGADNVAAQLERPFTFGGAARSVAPEVAGNALPRAALGAVASLAGGGAVAKTLQGGGQLAQGTARALMDAPRAQIIGGTAANLAANVARDSGASLPVQVGSAILAGGVAPGAFDAAATGIGRSVAPLVPQSFRGRVSSTSRPGYVREQAARILQDNVQGDRGRVISRIEQATARPSVSGAVPTTAEVAGDYGLAGFQRSLQANSKTGGDISRRLAENASSRLSAADRALGPGDTSRLAAAADAQVASNNRMLDAYRGRVGPLEAADATGASVRDLLQERAAAAKARAARLYDIPGGDEPVQVGAFDDLMTAPPANDGAVGRFARDMRSTLNERIPDATGAGTRAQGGTLAGLLKGKVHPQSPLGRDLTRMGYGPQQRPDLYNNRANPRMELDKTITTARESGFLPPAPADAPDTYGANDFLDALLGDLAATGRGGAGSRAMTAEGMLSAGEARARQQNQDYVRQMFDEAGLDPQNMKADDWDAFYRRMNDLPPAVVGADDMAFLSDGANAAAGAATLSPFQASLVGLQRQFFPAGLPAKSGVSALIRQLTNADVMETRQVERVIRDLRAQSGLLKQSDGVSAALAKAAADAAEGFLSSQAGPARMEAMQRARAGWRDYSNTYRANEPGRVLATDRFGNPMMDAGRISQTLVPAGRTGATAAARLQKALGADGAEAVARTELRRALEAAGNDAGKVAAVADRYADTLRAYPDLAKDVGFARESAALADAFTRSPLARVGAAGDPIAAVGGLLRQQDGGRALRELAKQVRSDLSAAAGLRRAIAGHIEGVSSARKSVESGGARAVLNGELMTALDDVLHKTAQTGLLTRQQRQVLLNVRMEAKRAQFAANANRTPGSDTARNADTMGRFAMVVAKGIGGAKVGAMDTVIQAAVAILGRADAVRQLTAEAMLDPKLAAELLKTPTPDRMRALSDRVAGYSRGAAITAYSADNM